MIGIGGLQYYFSFLFSAARAATHLCDQLKRSLIRAKIREVHHTIRVKHTH